VGSDGATDKLTANACVVGQQHSASVSSTFAIAAPGSYEFINPIYRSYIASAWSVPGLTNCLVLAYFKDQLKIKRIGIITTAETIGQAVANQFAATVAKLLGIEVAHRAARVRSGSAALIAPTRQDLKLLTDCQVAEELTNGKR
jgi:hypothetical protein